MLNKSRVLNDGSYPLVFQVIHNRRKKLLYTGYRLREEAFDESEEKIIDNTGSFYKVTEVTKMNRELRKMRNRIDIQIKQFKQTREGLQYRIFWLQIPREMENRSFIYCNMSTRKLYGSVN